MKQIVLIAFAAISLLGADATGKWTGSLIIAGADGDQDRTAHLVLKQTGTTVTGTAGPNAGEQHPLENGKAEGGIITFDVPTGQTVMKFSLKQEGDEIRGTVTRSREGQTQTAKLAVKREP